MGKNHRSNMTKFLLATLAFLAVASATDVYGLIYVGSARSPCTGVQTNFKITLDKCYLNSAGPFFPMYYAKVTLSGTTYSFKAYTDSSCATSGGDITTAADTCKDVTLGGQQISLKFSSGSVYPPLTRNFNKDCTSGTCTAGATDAPTSGAVASATDVYASIYAGNASTPCTGVQTNFKITLGKCYLNSAGPVLPMYYAKATLSGTTYSFAFYTDPSCATSVGGDTTTAADTCTDAQTGSTPISLKFSSGSVYPPLTSIFNNDCTSGTCTAGATDAPTPGATDAPTPGATSNSAGHVSVGIISACLAIMAQWVA